MLCNHGQEIKLRQPQLNGCHDSDHAMCVWMRGKSPSTLRSVLFTASKDPAGTIYLKDTLTMPKCTYSGSASSLQNFHTAPDGDLEPIPRPGASRAFGTLEIQRLALFPLSKCSHSTALKALFMHLVLVRDRPIIEPVQQSSFAYKLVEQAALPYQLLWSVEFCHLPLLENDNSVRVQDRVDAMGDGDDGSVLEDRTSKRCLQ